MPLPAVLVVALVAAAFGCLVARSMLVARHRRDLSRRERQMTAAVEERYRAYVELEGKVRRMLERLDAIELETADGLARTGSRLRDLDEALAVCAGLPTSEAQLLSEDIAADESRALEWMDAVDEGDDAAVAVLLERETPARSATIEDWERRLEAFAAEKRAEIERQERVIADLTARLQEANAHADREHEEAEQAARADAELRHEAEVWRERHLALEAETARAIAAVRARAEQADAFEETIAELRQRGAELDAELARMRRSMDELGARAEAERAEVEARLARSEEEGARAREEQLADAARAEGLEGTVAGLRERVAALQEELAAERTALEETRARFDDELAHERAERAAEAESHKREAKGLMARIAELEPFVERERAATVELEQWQRKCERLRAEQAESDERHEEHLRSLSAELEQTRERLEGELVALEATRVAEVAGLERRVDELSALRPELETACTRVQELGAALAQREDDVAALEAQLAHAERRGDAARAELAELSEGLAEAQRDVASWRAEAERANAEREARVRELDERLAELEELSSMLKEATELHLGRIAELEDHERRLQSELLERTESLTMSRQRLQQAEETLATVSRLLRESRNEAA